MKGKLLVITGPSAGVGKDTLLKMFLDSHADWHRLTTVTTRAPRPGEVDGIDYKFVSKEEFERWQKEDKFLETDFHAGYWYGTLREPVEDALNRGENIVLRIDVNGSLNVMKLIPEAVIAYIDVDHPEQLESRIRNRAETSGESEEQIRSRLELAHKEMELKPQFKHVVVNPQGNPQEALANIEKILGV